MSVPVGNGVGFSLGWETAPCQCLAGPPSPQPLEEAGLSQGLGLRAIPASLIPVLLAGLCPRAAAQCERGGRTGRAGSCAVLCRFHPEQRDPWSRHWDVGGSKREGLDPAPHHASPEHPPVPPQLPPHPNTRMRHPPCPVGHVHPGLGGDEVGQENPGCHDAPEPAARKGFGDGLAAIWPLGCCWSLPRPFQPFLAGGHSLISFPQPAPLGTTAFLPVLRHPTGQGYSARRRPQRCSEVYRRRPGDAESRLGSAPGTSIAAAPAPATLRARGGSQHPTVPVPGASLAPCPAAGIGVLPCSPAVPQFPFSILRWGPSSPCSVGWGVTWGGGGGSGPSPAGSGCPGSARSHGHLLSVQPARLSPPPAFWGYHHQPPPVLPGNHPPLPHHHQGDERRRRRAVPMATAQAPILPPQRYPGAGRCLGDTRGVVVVVPPIRLASPPACSCVLGRGAQHPTTTTTYTQDIAGCSASFFFLGGGG